MKYTTRLLRLWNIAIGFVPRTGFAQIFRHISEEEDALKTGIMAGMLIRHRLIRTLRTRILISLIGTLFAFLKTQGQAFRNITEMDGEHISEVSGITQGKDGFMWFSSPDGLIRYDTRTLKLYKRDSKGNPILNNSVDMLCDSRGYIWVATVSGFVFYNPDVDSFTHFNQNPVPKTTHSSNYFTCITEDSQKQIWLGTGYGLVRVIVDHGVPKQARYLLPESDGQTSIVQCLAAGKDGNLWIGTADGLVRMPVSGGKSKLYRMPSTKLNVLSNDFRAVYADDKGSIWGGNSRGGLFRFDIKTERFWYIETVKSPADGFFVIRKIAPDSNGKLWLATSSGLAYFDPQTEQANWYINRPDDPYSLSANSLFSMYLDNQGGLWLGSYYTGISYLYINSPRFRRWPFSRDDTSYKSFTNAWLGKGKTNRLWSISDKADKLLIFDTNGKHPLTFPLHLDPKADYYSFYLDRNDVLWAGGNSVLTRYNTRRGTYHHYPFLIPGKDKPLTGRTYMLTEDSYGRFWIAGVYGLLLFDKQNGSWTRVPNIFGITTIYEDSHRTIWIGGDNSIYRIKSEVSNIRVPRVEKCPAPLAPSGLNIWRFSEDRSGKIWAACTHQLLVYNPNANRFELNTDVPGEVDLDVVPDDQGYLWINADTKLYRYHSKNRTIQTYGYQDGLPDKGFLMQGAGTKDQHGNLYFASNKGMFTFDPTAIRVNNRASPIVLTALKLYNKEIKVGDTTGILTKPLNQAKEMTFRHDQTVFTIDFALLDYTRSSNNRYAYKMEGIDRDWNYVQAPSATYTNLPTGSHTFQVRAANGDGVWMKEPLTITITILPPWWRTWYAYLFYVLLLAATVYVVTRFFWLRSVFRRESALNQVKLDFFTNVSHEIRTHLSLISAPLEKAYDQLKDGKSPESNLNYARNSSDRLLVLVNELLDFRKIQSNGIRLQVQEYDIVRTLKSVVAAFEHLASQKAIETTLLCPDTPVLLWFDIAQMQKVFYNLLSNAYKFTPDGGRVTLQISQTANEVIILVKDTGKGIAKHHLQKLFTYYYQADSDEPGYGIGLALSKSIVEQHHGSLTAESQLATESSSGGTVLTIRMRQGNHYSLDQVAGKNTENAGIMLAGTMVMPVNLKTSTSTRRNTLLIIEDNDQLRVFIRELFDEEFTVLEAGDGVRGLELANEHIPDIVLCDVMMPGMNGLEVCKQIKNTLVTAHIPVLLLTARTQNEQIIEGLASGSDDYLIKPFDPRILSLKINNLIRQREELKQHYRRSLQEDSEDGSALANNINEAFLVSLKKEVLDHLIKADFGVDELAYQAGMSVSVLYRKIRALTGQTVNEFIKEVRLTEARRLLESGVYHVNEVAMLVGFDDSKYFSKEFKKAFGRSPSTMKNHPDR